MKATKIRWFRVTYCLFTLLLIILTLSAIFYVRGLLNKYEASQPEKQVAVAVDKLSLEAKNTADFWSKYNLPEVEDGIKQRFVKLLKNDNLVFFAGSSSAEDEACYQVKADGMPIAEVTLKAKGPVVTKLAVFSMRDWEIKSFKPIFEKKEYVLTLPETFTVSADGTPLSTEQGEKIDGGKLKYTLKDVYLQPQFEIKDPNGKKIGYSVQGSRIVPEIYEYNLTLPSTITVKVNGKASEGALTSDGRVKHAIMTTEKPEVIISDVYGNTLNYEGGSLPITYHMIEAPSSYTVELDGKPLHEKAISKSVPRKYDILVDLIKNLPTDTRFEVAILKDDAKVTVKDSSGKEIALKKGETEHDFTEDIKPSDTVPKEISDKIDVLKTAQNWSLFMSNDYSFTDIEKLLVPDSYQYKVAKAYSTSVDRQFFAGHTLSSPAFTENTVKNFCKITDDSFSVEISFVKHMQLTKSNRKVDDAMNDRFYFVLKDGKWLLAGLKEVETNE